jgi:predicted DNA binding CopG/RHH family protein
MAIKDTDRKARANYKKKITTIRMELYGTDEDIREHIEKLKEEGVSVQGYIKELIRADMNIKDAVREAMES